MKNTFPARNYLAILWHMEGRPIPAAVAFEVAVRPLPVLFGVLKVLHQLFIIYFQLSLFKGMKSNLLHIVCLLLAQVVVEVEEDLELD